MRLDQARRNRRRDPLLMEIRFPGGLEVQAVQGGFTIATDQPHVKVAWRITRRSCA